MIALHHCAAGQKTIDVDISTGKLRPDVVWIDLLNGTPEEIAFVENATGLSLPKYEELSEIETSSRLRYEHGVLFLSAPLVYRNEAREPFTTPLGFVLTRDLLITIRFTELPSFTSFRDRTAKTEIVHRSGAGAFVGLLEAIVDRLADVLENVGTELDTVSHRVFRTEAVQDKPKRKPAREDADLRVILGRLGRAGDLISKIRDSLLGIGRLVPYTKSLAAEWLPPEVNPHLDTLRQDIVSLSDYDNHLSNKLQLLLDATLGFINVEQNNIIKVLTIVSVVGVPPTLVASMYGMNFHNMPELSWAWGYPYGLALIVFSAIGPLLWFKLRGWL